MDYQTFDYLVKASPETLLRHYTCAVADQIKHLGKTNSIVQAIKLGEQMADGILNWSSDYEIRRLHTQLKALTINQGNFQKRVAREVALLCIGESISKAEFTTVMNAVRVFRGRNFDEDIAVCIRPSYLRISAGTRQPDILAMAHKMVGEKDWGVAPVLADALEEAGLFNGEAWSHLRNGRHCRGCWVLDDILGRWS